MKLLSLFTKSDSEDLIKLKENDESEEDIDFLNEINVHKVESNERVDRIKSGIEHLNNAENDMFSE